MRGEEEEEGRDTRIEQWGQERMGWRVRKGKERNTDHRWIKSKCTYSTKISWEIWRNRTSQKWTGLYDRYISPWLEFSNYRLFFINLKA